MLEVGGRERRMAKHGHDRRLRRALKSNYSGAHIKEYFPEICGSAT